MVWFSLSPFALPEGAIRYNLLTMPVPNVLIPTKRGEMPAYLASPLSADRAPGVVVLHDAGGMSQDHRSQADWLAEAGFLAVALDLYHRGGLVLCARTIIRDVIARRARLSPCTPGATEPKTAGSYSAR